MTTTCRSDRLASLLAGALLAPALLVAQSPPPPDPPTVRAGDHNAAPIVAARAGSPAGAGRIVGVAARSTPEITEAGHAARIGERVYIDSPAGAPAAVGTTYLAVSVGPALRDVGQVLLPTGLVVVERAEPGQRVEARVVKNFAPLSVGDWLIPADAPPGETARPVATTGGPTMRIVWAADAPAVIGPRGYVVLDRGTDAGLRPGDQVTVIRREPARADGPAAAEVEVAVLQVIRVFPNASSARVVRVIDGTSPEGATARVSAKMP